MKILRKTFIVFLCIICIFFSFPFSSYAATLEPSQSGNTLGFNCFTDDNPLVEQYISDIPNISSFVKYAKNNNCLCFVFVNTLSTNSHTYAHVVIASDNYSSSGGQYSTWVYILNGRFRITSLKGVDSSKYPQNSYQVLSVYTYDISDPSNTDNGWVADADFIDVSGNWDWTGYELLSYYAPTHHFLENAQGDEVEVIYFIRTTLTGGSIATYSAITYPSIINEDNNSEYFGTINGSPYGDPSFLNPGDDDDDEGNLLDKLKAWFQNLISSITNLSTNISNWFSTLWDNISTAFTTITNNISTFFDNLWGNIQGAFRSLSASIRGYFDNLINWLWYGNSDGESSYQPPTINNKLNDVITQLQSWRTSIHNYISSIDGYRDNVTGYLDTATSLTNGLLGVAGTGVMAMLSFGMVFLLVRKVVGR